MSVGQVNRELLDKIAALREEASQSGEYYVASCLASIAASLLQGERAISDMARTMLEQNRKSLDSCVERN